MDRIYQGATVTIINAANEGADDGLPGVSSTTRRCPHSLNINGMKLVQIPNSKETIGKSKWETRGWTYQEALLSRRRLVFTKEQVYFQCLEMHAVEIVKTVFSSRPSEEREKDPLSESLQVFPWGVATARRDIFARIYAYQKRELPYESDHLNAFLGIINQFWDSKDPVYHLWGLPFHTFPQTVPAETQLSNALLWLPVPFYSDPERFLTKRTEFPSWSWVAWRNLTGIREHVIDELSIGHLEKIHVLDLRSNKFEVDDYVRDMDLLRNVHRFSKRLSLTGWTTNMCFRLPNFKEENPYPPTGPSTKFEALDETRQFQVCEAIILTGLLIPQDLTVESIRKQHWPVLMFDNTRREATGIILRDTGNGTFQRFGVLRLGLEYHEQFYRESDSHYVCYLSERGMSLGQGRMSCERRTIFWSSGLVLYQEGVWVSDG